MSWSDGKGFSYPVGESYGCQWPVARGLAGAHFTVDRCGRNGYGNRLPVCWQHADALIDAAFDLIDNHGQRLKPYLLTQMLEAIHRAQPFGLDSVLVERLRGLRCGTYAMDPRLIVGDEFESAVELLLLDRIEARIDSPYSSPALNEALDRLIEKRLQQNWGVSA